jgi:hypothetical protein
VPYASVEHETSKFISPEFLLASFIIKDPWNQRKEEIESLLGYIKSRQEKHKPGEVFWFCGYQRKGDTKLVIANYPDGKQTNKQDHKKKAGLKCASHVVADACPSRIGTPFIIGLATLAPSTPSMPTPSPASTAAQTQSALGTPTPAPMQSPFLTPSWASRQSTLGMLTRSLPSTGKLTTSVLHLNQMQMNTLIAHGVHPIPPRNGPSDGEPIYELPATPTMPELLATQP